MPPRKEPKENIVYPASKRKVPAYKPLRPSGVPRIPTTESESSTTAVPPAAKKAAARKPSELGENGAEPATRPRHGVQIPKIDESEDGSDDPMTFRPASKVATARPAAKRQKTSTREASPIALSSNPNPDSGSHQDRPTDPMPSQSDDIPSIPQPLLVRLLHESFADKNTRIDTHAIQVLQKYVEIFVREAMARAQADRADRAERGEGAEQDASWLELEDLEAVAPGLILDF